MSQVFWSPGSFGGGSGGSGVSGPGSSTNNSIATFNGTSGDTIQSSFVTIDGTTGIIQATRSISSADQCFFQMENTNAGASADAGFQAVTVGGDPYLGLINATSTWAVFSDTSDSNTFKIQEGANLFFSVAQAGQIIFGQSGSSENHVFNGNDFIFNCNGTTQGIQLDGGEVRMDINGTSSAGIIEYRVENTSGGTSDVRFFGQTTHDTASAGVLLRRFGSTTHDVNWYIGTQDNGTRFFIGNTTNGLTNPQNNGSVYFTSTTSGALTLGPNGATPTHDLRTATATSATAGSNGDVPAQVDGYVEIQINGTVKKIPYYNT